eukprot:CAMPEP_0118889752 /NCGR_PEP_ID=MMETSP1166-20130328/528_1 /TAXON_ID=1104430 /ORGANISM="Chrysoreinhardia sp, Strain CCMP3193" /LENGTH=138 /DNA_ID=CAMNT_0006828347 /DNA_START=1 /DNA_END=418 /DNA_ORIENTATION=+
MALEEEQTTLREAWSEIPLCDVGDGGVRGGVALREDEYRSQIMALEEEQTTLREAWSEIVRTNTATAEDLQSQLREATNERDEARAELDTVLSEHKELQDGMAAELAAAKVAVAELSEQRDVMHHKLVSLLRAGGAEE